MKRMLQHVYVTFYTVQVRCKRFRKKLHYACTFSAVQKIKWLHFYHTLFLGNESICFDEMT